MRDIPATPHRPNPELSSVEPLLTSATAESALSNSFEPERFGAEKRTADVMNERRAPPDGGFDMYAAMPHTTGEARDGIERGLIGLNTPAAMVRGLSLYCRAMASDD